MPSLAQLLATHGHLLVLDAASACVQVGWLSAHEATWASSTDEAGKALFCGIDTVLNAAPNRSIATAGAFLFCEGPGSILGIRTAATAIRTWLTLHPQTPAYSYQSLALLAHGLGDATLTLIADARRDHWHVQKLGQALRQVPSSGLRHAPNAENPEPSDQSTLTRANEPLQKKQVYGMPEGFRHWTTPPPNLTRVPYDLETLFANERVQAAQLFTPAHEPDAFLHNEATYKTWSPQIHRPPAALNTPAAATK